MPRLTRKKIAKKAAASKARVAAKSAPKRARKARKLTGRELLNSLSRLDDAGAPKAKKAKARAR